MNNGEKCDQKWLMFSDSTGCVFCYVCKLFSTDYDNVFVKVAFTIGKKLNKLFSATKTARNIFNV